MNTNIDYKQKALKYKAKYLELKKQFEKLNFQNGGIIPEWYPQFENEMREIFFNVSNRYPNVVLTGSGAIAYLLKELGIDDELSNFKPGDLDLIYKSRVAEPNPKMIGDYKIKPGQEYESSVTFMLNTSDNKYIKSFDVSKTNPNIKSFKFNGIEIIDLNRLKSDYKPSFETPEERIEKDRYKMNLIEKIIQHIGKEGRLNEFGLDDNVTVRGDVKRKISSLFGNDDDADNDDTHKFMARNFSSMFGDFDSPIKPKSSGLFGYDSDDEK
jgi:hypothetical protein